MQARILIVDDDRATRVGLSELLEGHGYRTAMAGTLREALAHLSADPPALIIADVRLGAFNGLQLLMASSGSVPTIVITGHVDPVIEREARAAGADFVVKPIDLGVLLELVEQKLNPDGPESTHATTQPRM
jgi:DNA-binding NtrC family response regulator